MSKTPYLIAEVKTISPFGYKSQTSWRDLLDIAIVHGDMISVHTDARWGGSFDLIKQTRRYTDKPILAKGVHASDQDVMQALGCGANYVLVVGRIPAQELLSRCLIEPTSLDQLSEFSTVLPLAQRIVWNSRDLSTGETRSNNEFESARTLWNGWLCQASNITRPTDV